MLPRVIDISDYPASLNMRDGLLVIRSGDGAEATVPMSEVAAVVLSHPQTRISLGALAGITQAGGVVVAADDARLPCGMMLPLAANALQSERFRAQAEATLPKNKRLWQQVVKAKVAAQAALVEVLQGDDGGLGSFVPQVRSGDPLNIEAQAAKRYWALLRLGSEFRRDRDAEDANRYLNYGYAVLRAVVARAICSAGLHPSLGIHHHNRYDPFPLADDLMEPFRPIVDRAAIDVVREFGPDEPLIRDVKSMLIDAVLSRVLVDGERRTLMESATRLAASLNRCYLGESKDLVMPDVASTLRADAAESRAR